MRFCKAYYLFAVFAALSLVRCVPDVDEFTETEPIASEILFIDIPENFDYKTHQQVEIQITDNTPNVKYDVFIYSNQNNYFGVQTFENESGEQETEEVFREDLVNKLVFTGVPKNGILQVFLTLPKYCSKVNIRRRENLKYSSQLVQITNKKANFTYVNNSNRTTIVEDLLYCVNGSGELFHVDPLNGDLTMVSDMPMGSFTAAINQDSLMLYSIGRSNPFPLMRYSIEDDDWDIISNLGMGGPRLDYNKNDDLLYFSRHDQLYTINPQTGVVIDQWTVHGIHNTNGGDLAFAEDGTLFLASFSGLYRCDYNGLDYDAVRISADNLPFYPTSMTFDSNQELWLANSAASSDLIIMDTTTGGWQINYGINAGNNTDFGRTINDLTTLRIYSENTNTTDSDGDGIIDIDDAYPDDDEKAFEVFTPSRYGNGTIAFEDLWPSYGDYDYNDLAFTYRAIVILNANNEVVQINFICRVKSNGAGYTNGFGIEIEGLSPSQIESVSGANYSHNYISLESNGVESGQDNAVIIFTDDADNFLQETTVTIDLTSPVTTAVLGEAPFNPFIIVNKERHKEVHLPYYSRTNLGTNVSTTEGVNSDVDGNFISDNGLPWAISIVHDFKVPKENISITQAYNFFTTWATSGGIDYPDWYKDNPGYRNSSLIED